MASGLAEKTWIREKTPSCVRIAAADVENVQGGTRSERKREKAKRFVAKKGPRMVGAAAAIGMFIFNVVSACA